MGEAFITRAITLAMISKKDPHYIMNYRCAEWNIGDARCILYSFEQEKLIPPECIYIFVVENGTKNLCYFTVEKSLDEKYRLCSCGSKIIHINFCEVLLDVKEISEKIATIIADDVNGDLCITL